MGTLPWRWTAAVDEQLLAHVHRVPSRDHAELLFGLAGMGIYALNRLPRRAAVECLELIVDHLLARAERRPTGIAWWTPPTARRPRGCYGVGPAHGSAGVIAFLARAYVAGIATHRVERALAAAVGWTLAQRLGPGAVSAFPFAVDPGRPEAPSHLGWCSSDVGIAASLLLAARAVDEPSWEGAALEIALRASERPFDRADVDDAGFCHGAVGVGHLFNRASGLPASAAWPRRPGAGSPMAWR